ncbi:MAG TPA: hypothetical protein VJV03_01770, partial [Pyrinomonadaceae bacterium]|nr:hypothetical protein [Pyrinomonadaceae bacterium]
LLGFRLGMTTDEVKKRVPQVVFGRVDDFAVSKTTINPDFDTRIDKASFPGVRTISLDFLDGKLTSLWFGYDPTFKWRTVDEYVKGISQALRLPATWTTWRIRGQRLRCADFELTVSMLGEGPSFRILDLSAEEAIAARRRAKEEEAAALEQQEEAAVLGNKKEKVFYLPACAPAEDNLKESERVIFKSREEAEKAGYKLASECE